MPMLNPCLELTSWVPGRLEANAVPQVRPVPVVANSSPLLRAKVGCSLVASLLTPHISHFSFLFKIFIYLAVTLPDR